MFALYLITVLCCMSCWFWASMKPSLGGLARQQRVRINGQLSSTISPRGGIPQGTRLAPLLFAVLVNRLASEWRTRLKYVDDLTILDLIPTNSSSYLPIIASSINKYSLKRNMKLNPKKCKEIVVDFIPKFITWLVNSALNCARKPISHESRKR